MNIVPSGNALASGVSSASWALRDAICSLVSAPPQQGQAMLRPAEEEGADSQENPAASGKSFMAILRLRRSDVPHVAPCDVARLYGACKIGASSESLRGGRMAARGQSEHRGLLLDLIAFAENAGKIGDRRRVRKGSHAAPQLGRDAPMGRAALMSVVDQDSRELLVPPAVEPCNRIEAAFNEQRFQHHVVPRALREALRWERVLMRHRFEHRAH